MKKFLTVLLVIAVMFTFSFSSAFATVAGDILSNCVETKAEAVKALQDKAAAYSTSITNDLNKLLADYVDGTTITDISKAAYTAVMNDLADQAQVTLNQQLSQALIELEAKITAMGTAEIKGYDLVETANGTNYVAVGSALAMLTAPKFAKTYPISNTTVKNNAAIEEYDVAMEKTVNLIKNYDLAQFATDDDYAGTGLSSYETAANAQKTALTTLGNQTRQKTVYGDIVGDEKEIAADIYAVYKVTNAGKVNESYSGSFYNDVKNLKTVTTQKTDATKVAYAKNIVVPQVKSLIETERNGELKTWNDVILTQSVSKNPDQKKIDEANDKIKEINEKYDAYTEVWMYRLDNGRWDVEPVSGNEYINVYYGTGTSTKLAYVGYFGGAGFTYVGSNVATWGDLSGKLGVDAAVSIVEDVEDLKEQAELIKANVAVDGDVAIDVDAALADAIEKEYMTGSNSGLGTATVKTATHARTHELLGTACGTKPAPTGKVVVGEKKYDRVASWTTAGYSTDNTAAVKAIIKETKAAIKAATTVAEADATFLAGYEKYDAVLTTAEQAALFNYGGELYGKDTTAKAEIGAYVKYKVELMGKDWAGTDASGSTLASYLKSHLLDEVNNAADLDAAVASAKTVVDTLKTKAELKAQNADLNKKIAAVAIPVKAENKEEVIALYREYVDFLDYCAMIGYTADTTAQTLIRTDVKAAAALDADTMTELVKAIDKDGKITLEDRANVEALVAAADAYEALYVEDINELESGKPLALNAVPTFTGLKSTASGYEKAIFALDVIEVNKKLAALPTDATAEQVAAARAAVDALGYDGICAINKTYLTKLNKFEQDAAFTAEDAKAYVQDLSIKARSTKTSKGVKVTIKADVQTLLDAGYTVEYKFYRSTKSNAKFGSPKITKTTNTYLNTSGKKGTRYYYKARLVVKNAKGEVVAITPLSQCLYATRVF